MRVMLSVLVLIETLWNVNFCFTVAKQILGVF